MKYLQIVVKGLVPLIMHNITLLDPMNPFTKRFKEVSGKRKKTEADLIEMQWIEFQAHLYNAVPDLHADNPKVVPYIPAIAIEATIREGAKKSRQGKLVQGCVEVRPSPDSVDEAVPLVYSPVHDTVARMYADKSFVDLRPVVVNRARVLRCRPIFRNWGAQFTVGYDPREINQADVVKILGEAGKVGFLEWRPRFGRFEVVDIKD